MLWQRLTLDFDSTLDSNNEEEQPLKLKPKMLSKK